MEAAGLKLAVRAYRHGGLFRAFTRSLFLDSRRAISEGETLAHLLRDGRPGRRPLLPPSSKGVLLFKRLYLVTVFEEGAVNLLEYMKTAGKERKGGRHAGPCPPPRQMEQAGVYHRDLHFQNVLVTLESRLMLLDFDRAARKESLAKGRRIDGPQALALRR